MSDSETEFQPSVLGRQKYWDELYLKESQLYKEYGHEGEVWFGEDVERDMIHWLKQNNKLQGRILEIGCGNGHFWEAINNECPSEFPNLIYVGIDYSQNAVDFAKEYFSSQDLYIEDRVFLSVEDFTKPQTIRPDQQIQLNSGIDPSYSLIVDKGTFDAISLTGCTEDRNRYAINVNENLHSSGIFMIVSCNWTIDELNKHFSKYGLELRENVPRKKVFSFGGKQGSDVTIAVFQKKA